MTLERAWYEERTAPHQRIATLVQRLVDEQQQRATKLAQNYRLYGSPSQYVVASGGVPSLAQTYQDLTTTGRLRLNIVRNMIESMVSRITKNQPTASFLTDGADWTLQNQAKMLERCVRAVFSDGHVYRHAARAFRHAAICGTGAVKVYAQSTRIIFEAVRPTELWIDPIEAQYGDPRSIFQIKHYDRQLLRKRYPAKAKAITDAPRATNLSVFGSGVTSDMIRVSEAWHLPSADDADDGRHLITIETATLLDEQWTRPRFPFAIMQFEEPALGYWGTGLADQLLGAQQHINYLLRVIEANLKAGANLKVLLERGSNVYKSQLSPNMDVAAIEYTGKPPEFLVNSNVDPFIEHWLRQMIQYAHNVTGESELSAQGQKPAGLNSGIALETFNDIQSVRFMALGRNWENLFLDLAQLVIDTARGVLEREHELIATYRGAGATQKMNFADAIMSDDDYAIEVDAVSDLPNTTAGRKQDVQELAQAGLITDPKLGLKLLYRPDIDRYLDEQLAPQELIDQRIERIVRDGELLAPHPRMDLQLAYDRANLAYQRAELGGAPEEVLDQIGQFADLCQGLLQQSRMPAAPPAPAGEPPPPLQGPAGAIAPDATMPLGPAGAHPAGVAPGSVVPLS